MSLNVPNAAARAASVLAAGWLIAAGILAGPAAHAGVAAATPVAADKPYVVKDGNKLDMKTYKGFLYYGDQCMRCHGPDGAGSSYAPNLTQSLKVLTHDQFENTVVNGRKEVSASNDRVMPSFGTNSDVMDNIENIYGYLKARSDGALGRGHPEHLEE